MRGTASNRRSTKRRGWTRAISSISASGASRRSSRAKSGPSSASQHGAQPGRRFRVIRPGIVFEAGGVRIQQGGHQSARRDFRAAMSNALVLYLKLPRFWHVSRARAGLLLSDLRLNMTPAARPGETSARPVRSLEMPSNTLPRTGTTTSSQCLLAPSSFRSFGARAFVADCSGPPATGRCQPRRMAMNRSPKQRRAGDRHRGRREPQGGPITTTAAPARAATA